MGEHYTLQKYTFINRKLTSYGTMYRVPQPLCLYMYNMHKHNILYAWADCTVAADLGTTVIILPEVYLSNLIGEIIVC